MLRNSFLLVFLVQSFALLALSAVVDRSKPPQTPPLQDYKLPPVYETKLPNGLSIVLVEDPRFPLVTVRLGFVAGSRFDPGDLPGLSENVAALLTEGTKSRSSRQIAEELATIGGSLNGVSGPDGLTLAGSVLAENTAKLLDLLADVARNANFPEDEVELRKQNRQQSLLAQQAEPDFLGEQKLLSVVYGQNPYAHIAPTMESLERIDAKTLAGFRDTYLAPNNATLILVGRIPPRAEIIKTIENYFGSWERRELKPPSPAPVPAPQQQIVLIDRPGSVQADIRLGRIAVTRADPDYVPLVVANTILGGGLSSRLFNNIREKQGFAYDVHSALEPKRDSGLFTTVTQVRNDVVEPALKSLLTELEDMAKAPVTAAELNDSRNFLSGTFVMRLETQNGLAEQLNMMKIVGLPNDYLEKYTARIRAVGTEQVQNVARKYMMPDKAALVVVGDAGKIDTALGKFGKVQVTKSSQ
jgi:zinc protease